MLLDLLSTTLSSGPLFPNSSNLVGFVIPPNETLSVAHGGSFEGVVTWGALCAL